MNKIHVLDCTLRDGGYCNQWRFGFNNILDIINGLTKAKIDIIECGFLTQKIVYDKDVTKFTSLDEINDLIPKNKDGQMYVAMINYGEFDIDAIPNRKNEGLDGIRVVFHKKNRYEAIKFCEKIKEKGYLVFVQAMVSLSYTDEEFLELIRIANSFNPFAFYIVDSFGMMRRKSLLRLFYMVEHNLNDNINIGFHSHNNMQLAYSNAQSLIEAQTSRDLIIDSSVYGMGRGAGNLNTELFVEYLNEVNQSQYDMKPLLIIIDEILNDFYQKNYWGYSLPNYLSAAHAIHPNYASYLADKNTLTVEAMDAIFKLMSVEKGIEFDKDYIEQLYLEYMASGAVQKEHKEELFSSINGKTVLLIAPGKSAIDESEKIISCAKDENIVTVSVNYEYGHVRTDYIFMSNLRRYRELEDECKSKCITTSNITSNKTYYCTDYRSLLSPIEAVKDNAGMMAIQFFINFGASKILLAGFDGYTYDTSENYALENLEMITKNAVLDAMNQGMTEMISRFSNKIPVEFLTTRKNILIKRKKRMKGD